MKYMKKKVDLLVMGFKQPSTVSGNLGTYRFAKNIVYKYCSSTTILPQSKKAQALAHLVDQLDYNDHSVEHSYFQILKSIHK